MKKLYKIILSLILMISMFSLAACNNNSSSSDTTEVQDEEIYHIYELAVKDGKFSGTYDEWLLTIQGKDGVDGLSAYQLYKKAHPEYKGSLEEWLKSLNGKDGVNGLDAYELYKKANPEYKGSLEEWLNSLNGKDGVDGLSAYELYKKTNPQYKGTLQEWLDSLNGTDGQDGTDGVNGKSAYELYKEANPDYKGTLEQWLDSIQGKNGVNGQNAYELYCEANPEYKGTLQEWLDSLNGKNGVDGLSAYELYKEANPEYTGSLEDWLSSLHGKDGKDGLSAYELYKQLHPEYTGTLEQWLESLKGKNGSNGDNGLSAYEIYLKYHPEYTKTEEEWMNDLVNGNLAEKVEVFYTITFNTNCDTVLDPIKVKENTKAKEPTLPEQEAFIFGGWYYGDIKWEFSVFPVTKDITLDAHWNLKEKEFKANLVNNEITITGINPDYRGFDATNLVIPETYCGFPVKGIADNAFAGNPIIENVEIPTSVTYIGSSAFSQCVNLSSFYLGDNVTTYGTNILRGCSKIKKLASKDDVSLIQLFDNVSKDENNIPNLELYPIYNGTQFYNSNNVFNYIKKNQYVLRFINWPDHPIIKTCDFIKCIDMSKLNFNILKSNAFEYLQKINCVILPDSVVTIEKNAFYYCISLSIVNFSKRIQTIADYSFNRSGPSVIFYEGTIEEWNAIPLVDDYLNRYENILYNYKISSIKNVVTEKYNYYLTDKGDIAGLGAANDEYKSVNLPEEFPNTKILSLLSDGFNNHMLFNVDISNVDMIGHYCFNSANIQGDLILPKDLSFKGARAFNALNIENVIIDYMYQYVIPDSVNVGKILCYSSKNINDYRHYEIPACFNYGGEHGNEYGFEWALTNDGTITILGIPKNGYNKLTIPSTINNKPVTRLSNNCFANLKCNVVDLTGSITDIGAKAFWYCSIDNLKIIIGDNIKELDQSDFDHLRLATFQVFVNTDKLSPLWDSDWDKGIVFDEQNNQIAAVKSYYKGTWEYSAETGEPTPINPTPNPVEPSQAPIA